MMACSDSARHYVSLEEAAALAGAHFNQPNLEVVHCRVEPFSNEKLGYLGEHGLLSIAVRRPDDEQPPRRSPDSCTFFVKALLPNADGFQRLIFEEERQFFATALPRLLDNFRGEPWAPECCLVKDELLVLEDLRARGFKHVGSELTADQLKTAMATVARFHACSMMLRDKLPGRALPQAFPGHFQEKTFVDDNGGSASKWLHTGARVIESVARDLGLDPKHVSVAYDVTLQQIQSADTNPDSVLTHEDLWTNNIMFSDDEQSCRLLDFQMLAHGSLAIDVLQLLYLNADKLTRQRCEPQLLRHYHSVLKDTLVDHGLPADGVLSLEQVFEAVEKNRIYGLVVAAQFYPISLLNKQFAKEYFARFLYYSYTNRTDFVNRAMQEDQRYRHRIQELVRELVDFMEHFRNN